MSAVAVDTSVLLAIFKGEPRDELWLETLQSAAEAASLLVSSIVLAEVRLFFPSDEACRKALRDLDLKHSSLTEDASLLAGKIFRSYRNEGGRRTTILPDFLVAAHAATQAESLATEDRGYLRAYFPNIRLLTPATPN
ncbi:MAG: type II toxin-antitoxin system VapC family toxin [Verrucomicrobia bacterium]|nr:type II toxin-antitoxin system VapC family toxin [Verrucomicrobiota bacterium]